MEQKSEKLGILVDLDRCVGCFTCEIACLQENIQNGNNQKNIHIIEIGPKTIKGRLRMDYLPIISADCSLCKSRILKNLMPSCVTTCPTKALFLGDEYEILDYLYSGKRFQICKIIEFR